jgi:hypothetical protein
MPADLTLPSLTTQLVQVPIQVTFEGAPYDPTADVVAFAFVNGNAYPATWYTGSWQTTVQGNYLAQCLIGPVGGVVALAPATYTVWVKITDDPEVPVLSTGSLQIT